MGVQRNFRKFMSLRNWGWFIIIQKTNSAYGAYQEQLETKAKLQQDIVEIKAEKDALMKQIEAEQGNLSQYHDKQARMTVQKEAAEKALVVAGEKLITMEANRQQAA